MNTPNESTKLSSADEVAYGKVGRRRFLGASSAVAPVVLTMLSQPALGTTCFTPSRALSKNTSISQAGKYGECSGAQSPGNYAQQTASGSPAYSWPTYPTPTTPFHPTFSGLVFTKTVNNHTVSMSMIEVLNLDPSQDPGKVAFHLIGAYLNCLGGNGAVIPSNVMAPSRVLEIWTEWRTKSYFEPTAGVKWYAADIKDYLISNGIVS